MFWSEVCSALFLFRFYFWSKKRGQKTWWLFDKKGKFNFVTTHQSLDIIITCSVKWEVKYVLCPQTYGTTPFTYIFDKETVVKKHNFIARFVLVSAHKFPCRFSLAPYMFDFFVLSCCVRYHLRRHPLPAI